MSSSTSTPTSTPIGSNQLETGVSGSATGDHQQTSQGPPPSIDLELGEKEVNEGSTSPNKDGLTSAVWAYFKRENINGVWKAICKYCKK